MNNTAKKLGKIHNNHKHEWKINKIIKQGQKKEKREDKLGKKGKGKLESGRERWEIVKSKVIPLQAWTGPEVSRRVRFPDFWKIIIRRNKKGRDRKRDKKTQHGGTAYNPPHSSSHSSTGANDTKIEASKRRLS
jgi:hypothetical protein